MNLTRDSNGQSSSDSVHAFGRPKLRLVRGYECPANLQSASSVYGVSDMQFNSIEGVDYSRHSLTKHNVADDLLWLDFASDRPNEKWTTEFTYIWVKDRWLHLAMVMDMALSQRTAAPGLIAHSDRGAQHRSQVYIDYLRTSDISINMMPKGSPQV